MHQPGASHQSGAHQNSARTKVVRIGETVVFSPHRVNTYKKTLDTAAILQVKWRDII
jgi:hypothetical protein